MDINITFFITLQICQKHNVLETNMKKLPGNLTTAWEPGSQVSTIYPTLVKGWDNCKGLVSS